MAMHGSQSLFLQDKQPLAYYEMWCSGYILFCAAELSDGVSF